MSFHISFVTLSMLASAAVAFGIACYGFTHFRTRGAKELAICCLMVAVWSASNAMEYSVTDLSAALVWTNIQYFAYAISPLCWFVLIFRFNGKEKYLSARNLILLSLVPAVTSILVWFDPLLGLVRHSFSVKYSGNIPYLAKSFGPWFWVHFLYSYGFNLADLCFLVAAIGKRGSLFSRQSMYILVSVSLVFGTNLSYVLGYTPVKNIDFSSVSIGLASLVLWWGIFRHKIFTIPPVARAKIFELMANGILVVDENWSLIDSNEAARRMFGFLGPGLVGGSLRERLPPLAAVTEEKLPTSEATAGIEALRWEIRMGRESEERFYELDASRLQDRAYKNAWVITAEDVTDLRRAREQIIRQREELAVAADRANLSMELHDTLGQVLSFAVIQSNTVLRELGRGNYPLAASYIERVRDILKDTHDDLRGFVRGIRMSEYDAQTFASILKQEAERVRQSCGIDVTLSLPAEETDLSQFQKSHLASIIKETLNNIAKHAKASRISIDFSAMPGGYRLDIEDDGIGLDEQRSSFARGSGIGFMRERAASIGGSLELSTRPSGGTRVVVTFPDTGEKTSTDR